MRRLLQWLVPVLSAVAVGEAQDVSRIPFSIELLGPAVNSSADDYAPWIFRDTLFFTSNREKDSRGAADLFVARRDGSEWRGPANAGAIFNTEKNDGALSIAGDGRTVVFAADDRDDGWGDTDLFIGELTNGVVRNVKNLGPEVNSGRWESQPVISADGTTIYFASNRGGGMGGTDIWMTRRKAGGTWAIAVNLGSAVNTSGEERSPFITADGLRLFFASDGHGGYGGKDIFVSSLGDGVWHAPENLGPAVNSPEDELFFHAPCSDRGFYFSSARPGGYGGLDIYSGTPNVFGGGMFRLIVSVLDSASRTPIPGIVTIRDAMDGTTFASVSAGASVGECLQVLPVERTYRVEVQVRDYPVRTAEVREVPPGGERRLEFLYGPLVIKEFDLGMYNVPFFVTGYYRPNVPENLDRLFALQEGPLKCASYIERFPRGSPRHGEYRAWAQTVEGIFRTVYTAAVEEIFPRFKNQRLPSEALEITVIGYADPQPLTGEYLEPDEIHFHDLNGVRRSVSRGGRLDNLKLSGLRAWHSGRYLDSLFLGAAREGHEEYAEMKREGKIRYRCVGGEVSREEGGYESRRRIQIIITRTASEK